MSPPNGVDYLDRDLSKHLRETEELISDNDDASVIPFLMNKFEKTGTSTWYKETVEWLLVYLATELGPTPHNIRQGHNAPSVLHTYHAVIRQLKQRRFEPWKRNESVKLVREYLSCSDELYSIKLVLTKKVALYKNLRNDCERFDMEDTMANTPINPHGETYVDRISWAIDSMQEQLEDCERLSSDLLHSLDALFQLRSIEQNELAIVADSQNQAIMVFTGVTIIFLPLSFFTSYYGMNLKGIANTNKNEAYFWEVCGTAGFLIVLTVCMYAWRHKVIQTISNRTMKGRGVLKGLAMA